MWVGIAFQAVMFLLAHGVEILAIIQALFAFFKANRNNSHMSGWMVEFASVMGQAKATRDPRPVRDFLAKLENEVKGDVK